MSKKPNIGRKKRPLILLHGLGATHYCWRYFEAALADDYDLYTPDLLGFGNNPVASGTPLGPLYQAAFVARMIEKNDLHDVVVLGNSLGGGVALSLVLDRAGLGEDAATLPDVRGRIAGVVLLSSIAYPQKWPFYLDLLRRQGLGDVALKLLPARFIVREVLKFGYHDPRKIKQATVDVYAKPLSCGAQKRCLLQAVRQLQPANIDQITTRFADITQPVLVLYGANDKVVPEWVAKKLMSILPDAQLAALPNCGHLPQEECPDAALLVIKTFLTSLD